MIVSCTDAIDKDREKFIQAQDELTDRNCQKAITILETMENRQNNIRWYQTMASAQSCFSSFSEISFFADSVDRVDISPISDLGKSLASFDISDDMESTDDQDYTSLRDAIGTLIDAGKPKSPKYKDRGDIWPKKDNDNISLQAIYLTLAALGMYMNYYGNGQETDGGKGGGPGLNKCYLDYGTFDPINDPIDRQIIYTALSVPGNTMGPCAIGESGHPDLPRSPSGPTLSGTTLTRACEGITLVNTLFDSLRAIPVPEDSGEIGGIGKVLGTIITSCDTALTAASIDSKICSSTSLKECEDIGKANPERIEQYFALVFENIHGG